MQVFSFLMDESTDRGDEKVVAVIVKFFEECEGKVATISSTICQYHNVRLQLGRRSSVQLKNGLCIITILEEIFLIQLLTKQLSWLVDPTQSFHASGIFNPMHVYSLPCIYYSIHNVCKYAVK